ncbi:hypothetical protein Q9L58_006309 [Maublancomyces gigas]|uniref:Glutathione S-transferase n=1 Tax=Discina gigas TaxID=1032678 RepID=A0ABR3GFQ8_9PEZI
MSESITLHSHKGGPNPWKVVMVLEELGLKYNTIFVDANTGEHKKGPYTALNPNGRMPTLVDHSNNDFTIWESGAIVLYLIGKYDTTHKISFPDFDSTAIANQYLMFQMSGQGPYFGQAAWFMHFHSEKLPSAVERYVAEIHRILGVLDGILADKEYLVGGKASYADLSFIPWNWAFGFFGEHVAGWEEKYPNFTAWNTRLNERAAVKKTKADKAAVN